MNVKSAKETAQGLPEPTTGKLAGIANRREYAERWRVSLRTVDAWLRRGLPHVKVSFKVVRIVVDDADRWMVEHFGQQRRAA